MRRICFANQKGGVGKTEGSKNVSVGLAQRGYKVLCVDLDESGNLSKQMIEKKEVTIDICDWKEIEEEFENSDQELSTVLNIMSKRFGSQEKLFESADVLMNPSAIENAIQTTRYENVDCISSSKKLMLVDDVLKNKKFDVYKVLDKALEKVEEKYDYCVIDTAPITNYVTLNAVGACLNKTEKDKNMIIVPNKNNAGTWEGTIETFQDIISLCVQESAGADIRLAFMMTNRTKNDIAAERVIMKMFKENILHSTIRHQNAPVTQTSFDKKAVICMNKPISRDYEAFIDEIIQLESEVRR